MKEQQELVFDQHSYAIYSYQGHFNRDLVTGKLDMGLELCIPAINMESISPWIMQTKMQKDLTIKRNLSKNGQPFKTVFFDFMGVRCTGYYEEYDSVRKEVVLHLTAEFENRIVTNGAQRQKIINLLA